MRSLASQLAVLGLSASAAVAQGLPLDTSDPTSIRSAASNIVYNLLKTYYTGNVTSSQLGLLPQPYYWWEAGSMWGGLLDYTDMVGDKTYVEEIGQAIASQASPTTDFMMPNQAFDLGNDDHAFWGLTAMTATEINFPVPSGFPESLWYNLSVNTFNDLASRWNTTQCNGGLKWQFNPANNGFDYKSTIANAAFMQLAARLARYTGNITYAEWADRAMSWMEGVQFVNTTSWLVNDGAGDLNNCTTIGTQHWSYNPACTLYGSVVMYNITSSPTWLTRVNGLAAATAQHYFGPDSNSTGIMFEPDCEPAANCDNDEYSFKAILSRNIGKSLILMPELGSTFKPLLEASATAAAASCAGDGNNTCGTRWYTGGFDGNVGVGQQMSAFETIQSLLAADGLVYPPATVGGLPWSSSS